jgi:hypothetical protein
MFLLGDADELGHILKRMATWGLNTIANWSDPALWAARRAAYVIPLEGWGMESGWFGIVAPQPIVANHGCVRAR